jgi:hypothetical protein
MDYDIDEEGKILTIKGSVGSDGKKIVEMFDKLGLLFGYYSLMPLSSYVSKPTECNIKYAIVKLND